MKTVYFEGRNGHQAETHTPADGNGKFWEIRTSKARGGIDCTATEMTDSGNGMVSVDLFGAKRHALISQPGRATESKIKEVHEKGLAEFARIMAEEQATTPPPYIIGIGQIMWTDWINGSNDANRRAVCEVIRPGQYRTVLLDGSGFRFDDHVKNYNDKFGIGTYYNEGDKISPEEVAALVSQATKSEELRAQAKQAEEIAAKEERTRKIAEGSKILSEIPAGALAVIVAERHEDKSDPQSDYWGYETKEIVYLAFSSHTKDLFSEMRKAAANFEPTQPYTTPAPDGNDEHREKYTGGSGYYLGESKYHGWIIKKCDLSVNGSYGVTLEALQVAAAEGRYFCNAEQITRTQEPAFEKVEVTAGTVQIIDYSERAIAVIGDTKPIKDKLKDLGGKFNFRLSCGAGWIFPKTKLDTLQKALAA